MTADALLPSGGGAEMETSSGTAVPGLDCVLRLHLGLGGLLGGEPRASSLARAWAATAACRRAFLGLHLRDLVLDRGEQLLALREASFDRLLLRRALGDDRPGPRGRPRGAPGVSRPPSGTA